MAGAKGHTKPLPDRITTTLLFSEGLVAIGKAEKLILFCEWIYLKKLQSLYSPDLLRRLYSSLNGWRHKIWS